MGKTILDKVNKNVKFTPNKLKGLFRYAKKNTNNFTIFKPEFLASRPSVIKIFRLMIGLNIINFGKRFGKSSSLIQSLEEERFNLSLSKANEYLEVVKNLAKQYDFKNIDYKILRNNYNKFYTNRLFSIMQSRVSHEVHVATGKKAGKVTLAKYGIKHFKNIAKIGARRGGIAVSKKYNHKHFQKIGKMTSEVHGSKKLSEWGRIGGIKTASKQKLTEQEIMIKRFLGKNGIKNISHKIIKGKGRKYVVDFLINNKNNPIIIEATNQTNNKGVGCYNKALELVKRAKNITNLNPKLKFVFILNKKFSIEGSIKLSRYGSIVVNDKINLLKEVIENIENGERIKTLNKGVIEYMLIDKKRFSKAGIAVKDLNEQEEEILIKNYLTKLGISFEAQAVLKNKFGSIRIVDFIIPSVEDPRVIIEVTKIKGKSNKTLFRVVNRLEERFRLIEDFYVKKGTYIGIINNVKQDDLDNFKIKYPLLSMDKLKDINKFI